MRLLLIEDDAKTAAHLCRGLRESGYVVDHAADGELGLSLAREGIYEVFVIDRMLPGLNGLELVSAMRRGGLGAPVLMLSALGSPLDRVAGLRAGADDYLAKPYAFAELLARLESLIRRRRGTEGHLRVGDLVLDVRQRSVRRGTAVIDLQFREFLLLQLLMRNAGSVVTRAMLIEAAWDYAFEPRGNIVDMHVHRLRKKIDGEGQESLIKTVPGAGYMIEG